MEVTPHVLHAYTHVQTCLVKSASVTVVIDDNGNDNNDDSLTLSSS